MLEPWEMTKDAFHNAVMAGKIIIGTKDEFFVPKAAIGKDSKYYTDIAHYNVIREALKEGKDIPEEILSEYPTL